MAKFRAKNPYKPTSTLKVCSCSQLTSFSFLITSTLFRLYFWLFLQRNIRQPQSIIFSNLDCERINIGAGNNQQSAAEANFTAVSVAVRFVFVMKYV